MVLGYHGRTVSEAEVRQLLGTTSFGTRAAAVLHVSSWGFDVQFGASNLPQLQAALAASAPPIVFVLAGTLDYWNINTAHTAVLVGLDGSAAFLNDPFFDSYPQQTSLPGFQQAWAATGHLAAVIRPRP